MKNKAVYFTYQIKSLNVWLGPCLFVNESHWKIDSRKYNENNLVLPKIDFYLCKLYRAQIAFDVYTRFMG